MLYKILPVLTIFACTASCGRLQKDVCICTKNVCICVFVFVLGVYLFSDDLLCFPGTAEIGDAPKTGDRNAGLGRSVVLWFCLYLCFLCICCCFLCIYCCFLFVCLEPSFAYSVLAS